MQKKLIKYFKECYQADNRNQTLWNIFTSKNEFLRVSSTEETQLFFSGQDFPLEEEYGSRLETAVATYRREKNLVFCSHFIVGRIESNSYGKKTLKKICSPLFFIEAVCENINDKHHFSGYIESFKWNYSLLYQLVGGRENADKIQDKFKQNKDFLDNTGLLLELNKYIDKGVIVLEDKSVQESNIFKELYSNHKANNEFSFIQTSAIMLLDRSVSSRGIIDELDLMSKSSNSSRPLMMIGGINNEPAKYAGFSKEAVKKTDCNNVPGLLSDAQKDIIEKSSNNVLSMLIGPPGTGKSYTIASLALERFMQGESVLVVSQNEHAVDVIKEKLVEHFGLAQNAVMRAGTKNYHRHLKRYLDSLTKGLGVDAPGSSKHKALKRLTKKIRSDESEFIKSLQKIEDDGELLYSIESGNKKAGFFNKFKLWLSKKRIDRYGLIQNELKAIQDMNAEREDLLSIHINDIFLRKIENTLKHHRTQLIKFRDALGARTSQKQEAVFSKVDFSILLESMPIWLCSLEALHKALPLKEELFDLVVIDEATQCDIASCLPALYRAKRALIVGDPKQLRHVSFLSRDRQKRLLEKCNLENVDFSYRDHSMIDIADQKIVSQSSVVTLDEHYRSTPQIIKFSNDTFYDSSLRVMTEKPQTTDINSVEVIKVENGQRSEGVNKSEAIAVCEKLRKLVDEQVVVPDEYKLSIGVLSFFRPQAECIQDIIYDKFPLDEISKHKIRSGTPYAFQGEERDIMLISCGVDRNSSSATYIYLNRSDVFNVSITRAREKQIIFLSAPEENMPASSLLRRYINSIENFAHEYRPNLDSRNEAIQEFVQVLLGLGINSLQNYPVAGIEMDLILMHEGETLAIDLVGFPGESSDSFHLDRYKIFERAGLRILPISFTGWRLKRETVIESIKQAFILLKEVNTISRLSVADFSHHWTKLLSENPVLANNVRSIEADLISLQNKKAVTQLGALIDQYQKVIWVLNEKLNKNELTYTRYTSSSEQVLLGGIDNLSQIVMLHKSISEISEGISSTRQTIRDDKEYVIERLHHENNAAIGVLEELALKWSKAKTFNQISIHGMDSALSDLANLVDRVDGY